MTTENVESSKKIFQKILEIKKKIFKYLKKNIWKYKKKLQKKKINKHKLKNI